mmetsp:Transcript_9257/g.30096  ORF Transcript_9257/g.30096 Transcript_9257/m.30096 type:complete len:263 (+) Transcript_9257:1465-2253(+)
MSPEEVLVRGGVVVVQESPDEIAAGGDEFEGRVLSGLVGVEVVAEKEGFGGEVEAGRLGGGGGDLRRAPRTPRGRRPLEEAEEAADVDRVAAPEDDGVGQGLPAGPALQGLPRALQPRHVGLPLSFVVVKVLLVFFPFTAAASRFLPPPRVGRRRIVEAAAAALLLCWGRRRQPRRRRLVDVARAQVGVLVRSAAEEDDVAVDESSLRRVEGHAVQSDAVHRLEVAHRPAPRDATELRVPPAHHQTRHVKDDVHFLLGPTHH